MANQRYSQGSRSIQVLGGICVGDPSASGGGTAIKKISVGSFTANTSSVALTTAETATFTLVGATTGDLVMVWPSTALEAGLTLMANANVTATSTVTVTFVNETTAAIVQTSGLTNRYLHIKL